MALEPCYLDVWYVLWRVDSGEEGWRQRRGLKCCG